MGAAAEPVRLQRGCSPFDLDDEASYRRWRAAKLGARPRRAADLIVDVADPSALSMGERAALLQRCARWNMAIYRCARSGADKALARGVGAQLGLHRLDANWLADEDGVSSIAVSRPLPSSALRAVPPEGERAAWDGPAPRRDDRGGFIPYTDKPIRWHTDGYYNPPQRRIRAMILHCVRPAASGGVNALLDHELAYIALRDASPRWMRALMADDAMVIPGRDDETGVARAAQAGPVFSVDAHDGTLHMRYTARTRSIEWKDDPATREAAAFLERFLSDDNAGVLRIRLEAGMGLVANNVLHDRSGFCDDPAAARLLYRARYLDRIAMPEAPWPNG
ncbi:MAG: TauD/TfdA family dioxygenase [Burkholderiaceae bacterium]|nr:TauD/TfdA family dioxygenase [Burkholderiaceae bacterium]